MIGHRRVSMSYLSWLCRGYIIPTYISSRDPSFPCTGGVLIIQGLRTTRPPASRGSPCSGTLVRLVLIFLGEAMPRTTTVLPNLPSWSGATLGEKITTLSWNGNWSGGRVPLNAGGRVLPLLHSP